MKRIAVVNVVLPQYRTDFFYLLREVLLKYDIELEVIYGKNNTVNTLNNDEVDIEWAKYIQNKTFTILKNSLIWQPYLKSIQNKDLVIIENANKLLMNYYLMVARKFSKYKVAYWDHGRNFQADINSWGNKFKYLFINQCDWWFGYTNLSRNILVSKKFPANRITVVQNAIDNQGIRKHYSELNEKDVFGIQKELGINTGTTAIYCGAMYPGKNFDFILETCYRVKQEIPDFNMIFIGAGMEAYKVLKAAETNPWIHYVGSKFGKDRVKYFKVSLIQLMPYYLGLGLLDSFALETPIITTSNPFHGPEIDYLENGINGFITEDNINDYSAKVVETLKSKSYLNLIEGCRSSAQKISLERMVENFKDGILLCLNTLKK